MPDQDQYLIGVEVEFPADPPRMPGRGLGLVARSPDRGQPILELYVRGQNP